MLTIIAFEPCKENEELLCHICSSVSSAPTFVCSLKNFQGCLSHPSANCQRHQLFSNSCYIHPIRMGMVPQECWRLPLCNHAKKMGNYYVRFPVPFCQLQRLFGRSKISKVASATRVPTANVTSHFLTRCIFTRLGWEWYHKNADDYSFQPCKENGELLCQISSSISQA